jgi:hypothetical protein
LRRFGGAAAINELQIATLIGSLSRSVLLTADIEHEEARAGVRDLSDAGAGPEEAKGEHRGHHCLAREPSGAKSQRTRYDETRDGVGDHLTEYRARDFRYAPIATNFRIAPK